MNRTKNQKEKCLLANQYNLRRITNKTMKKKSSDLLLKNLKIITESLENVLVPSIDYSPDTEKIAKYLRGELKESLLLKEPTMREKIIDNLHYISFDTLIYNLKKSVSKLLKKLDGRPWIAILYTNCQSEEDKEGAPAYNQFKSNVWIFRLCLKFIPEIRHNYPQGVVFCASDWKDNNIFSILNDNIRDLVFFDDVSFSGKQMEDTLWLTQKLMKQEPEKFHTFVCCHVIVSVTSSESLLVTKRMRNVYIHYGDIFPCIPFSEKELKIYQQLAQMETIHPLSGIYCQHKLADFVSIPVEEMSLLIKNCSESIRNLDTSAPNCPKVPYKSRKGHGPKTAYECNYVHFKNFIFA